MAELPIVDAIFTKIHALWSMNNSPFALEGESKGIPLRYPNVEYDSPTVGSTAWAEVMVRPEVSNVLQSIGKPRLYRKTGAIVLRFYFKSAGIAVTKAFKMVNTVADKLKRADVIKIQGGVSLQFGIGSQTSPLGNDPQYNNYFVILHESRFTYQELEDVNDS